MNEPQTIRNILAKYSANVVKALNAGNIKLICKELELEYTNKNEAMTLIEASNVLS